MVTEGAEGELDLEAVPFRSLLGERDEVMLQEGNPCLIWPLSWSPAPKALTWMPLLFLVTAWAILPQLLLPHGWMTAVLPLP